MAVDQLGLTDAQAALAFFKRHPAADFKHLRAAIKLPPRPDYFSDHMDLSIVVDRGDVWYDLPFDEKGNYKPQVRKKYPSLTLYTKVGSKQVALARWRTTIGGWRAEQARRRLRVLPLQAVGRRAARDPQRRLGAGLDRARVDADPLADQGQDRQWPLDARGQLRRARARATCRRTAWSRGTSWSPE